MSAQADLQTGAAPEATAPGSSGLSRRDFGRLLGVAALGATMPAWPRDASDVTTTTPPSELLPMSQDALVFMPATELAARLRRRDVSAREVLDAHLAQIQRVNPRVNAIVTLAEERARADAARADEAIAGGTALGPLHGIPMAHKDLVDTAGIRPRRARPSIETTSRPPMRSLSNGFARPASSRSARPTRRSSARARTRSTPSSARRGIRGTWRRRVAGAVEARRSRSRPA